MRVYDEFELPGLGWCLIEAEVTPKSLSTPHPHDPTWGDTDIDFNFDGLKVNGDKPNDNLRELAEEAILAKYEQAILEDAPTEAELREMEMERRADEARENSLLRRAI